ncbi:MAG: hypothetical protein ACRDZ3_07270 [Acidimicrobiia bacterium]
MNATTGEGLTLHVDGQPRTFAVGKTVSIGAHRFCDVDIETPEGGLPLRAVVLRFTEGTWVLSNVSERWIVLHTGGHPPLSLPPGGLVALTGAPFVVSVPGTATAAEVPVSFADFGATDADRCPWVRLDTGSETPEEAEAEAPVPARRTVRQVTAAVVTVLLIAGVGVAQAGRGAEEQPTAAEPKPPHPAAWDPRIADLVAFVEKDRELKFKEPVFVDFLEPEAFKETMVVDEAEVTDEEREEMRQSVALMRAVGLMEGDVDLLASSNQSSAEGTLAYYSAETDRITVRGTELNEHVKTTLVHELTHTLQDQHFDLDRIADDPQNWLRAVVEGDANRVEGHWLDQLDEAGLAAYEAQANAGFEAADFSGIPEVMLVLGGAPYNLGGAFVDVLAALGGNPAIDRALERPPASDEHLLDPFSYVDGDMAVTVPVPKLRSGESQIGEPDTFGAFGLFLMLAQRLDVAQAFRAADGWSGDAIVDFERDGRMCTRAAFRGDDEADTAELAGALDAWVKAMPPGVASTSNADGTVAFEACDPGVDFRIGEPRLMQAQSLPLVRADMVLAFIDMGSGPEKARCAASGLLNRLPPDYLLTDRKASSAEEQLMAEIGLECAHWSPPPA